MQLNTLYSKPFCQFKEYIQELKYIPIRKVATYRHVYRAEPKESTQSVSGSEIQNLPFSHSGIVSLYRSEPKEPT